MVWRARKYNRAVVETVLRLGGLAAVGINTDGELSAGGEAFALLQQYRRTGRWAVRAYGDGVPYANHSSPRAALVFFLHNYSEALLGKGLPRSLVNAQRLIDAYWTGNGWDARLGSRASYQLAARSPVDDT